MACSLCHRFGHNVSTCGDPKHFSTAERAAYAQLDAAGKHGFVTAWIQGRDAVLASPYATADMRAYDEALRRGDPLPPLQSLPASEVPSRRGTWAAAARLILFCALAALAITAIVIAILTLTAQTHPTAAAANAVSHAAPPIPTASARRPAPTRARDPLPAPLRSAPF